MQQILLLFCIVQSTTFCFYSKCKLSLRAIHKCQHFHECTNHKLSETPPPPKKKSTHQHFLSAKNLHENNKNQAKKLKVYGKKKRFSQPHPPPPLPPQPLYHVLGLYTRENVAP